VPGRFEASRSSTWSGRCHQVSRDRPKQGKALLEEQIGLVLLRIQLVNAIPAVGSGAAVHTFNKLQLAIAIHVFKAASAAGMLGERLGALQKGCVRS